MTDDMNVNWFRVCIAINGFRAKYGHWPEAIRLPKGSLDFLFKPSTLEKVNSRIRLIFDDSFYIAVDQQGNHYNFKTEGFLDGTDIDARDWLGVEPDFNSVDVDTEPIKYVFEPEISAMDIPEEPKMTDGKKKIEKKPEPVRTQKPKKEQRVKEPKIKKVEEKKPKEKKPRTRSGKSHPMVVVLVSEILLLIFSALYILLAFALNFQGQCIRMGTLAPCSMTEYLFQAMYLVPGRLVIMATSYWYVGLPLIVLFPLIGLAMNRRKGKKQTANIDIPIDL
jgi:hypothetical protein